MRNPSSQRTDLADRLVKLVKQFDTQQAAAEAGGVSLSQLKRYLSSQSDPPFSVISQMAAAVNCDMNWLATGTQTDHRWGWGDQAGEVMEFGPADTTSLPDNWSAIPIYDARFSAGHGSECANSVSRYHFAAEERWVHDVLKRNSSQLAGVHVVGDSMSPTLIDGDIVIVDLGAQHETPKDSIYVLRIEDTLYVKRLTMRIDGHILVSSDNSLYGSEVINPVVRELRIYGRVIAALHQM